jgi:hypothetical protein
MNKQDIARLIIDVCNAYKEDGHNEGYRQGYDKGYDRGFEAAREEFEVVVEVDEEEEEDDEYMPSSLAYDMGWNDGFVGKDPDEEMKHDRIYMFGYRYGRGERIDAMN